MQLAGARVVITDSGAEKGSLVRSESNGIVIQSAMVKEKVILHQWALHLRCRLLHNNIIMIHNPHYLPDTPGIGFEKRAYIVPENTGEARVCITTNVTLNANPVFGFVTTEDITATGMYISAFKVVLVQLTVQYYYNIPYAMKLAGREWNGDFWMHECTYMLCLYVQVVLAIIAYLCWTLSNAHVSGASLFWECFPSCLISLTRCQCSFCRCSLFSSLPLHLYRCAHYLPNCHASLDLHMTLPCPQNVCMNTWPHLVIALLEDWFHLVVSLVLKLHPSIPSLAIWISARGPGKLYHISDVTRRNTL